MESAHALAVVCRAKQIVREAGAQVEDATLGYMCRCSDIDGSWWDLLQTEPPVGHNRGTGTVLPCQRLANFRNRVITYVGSALQVRMKATGLLQLITPLLSRCVCSWSQGTESTG